MPAAFLSLDGLDGTGKSTQCRLLADRLRGRGLAVTECVDPGGTELGGRLREILLASRQTRIGMRTEALLFMASRAELVAQVIRPALDRGDVVVSDRFLLATVVYQGHAGGLPPDDLWAVGRFATGGLLPDLTLVSPVYLPGSARPESRHLFLEAAERAARRQLSQEGGGEMRFRGPDGRIRDTATVAPAARS